LNKFFIFILFICSCAPNVNYIMPITEQTPSPSYVLESTNDFKLNTVFYYSMFQGIKDIDGTEQLYPTYLDLFKKYDIFLNNKNIRKLTLTIEVVNPDEKKYTLKEVATYYDINGNKVDVTGNLGMSVLKYRKHVFDLPLTYKVKRMVYSVLLLDSDGNMIFTYGPFEYNIIM